MGDSFEFDVKMHTKNMYSYFLYYTYSRFSGWFGVGLSLVAFFMLVTNYASYDDAGKLVLLIISLAFTVLNPIMLLSRAKQQVMSNPVFKKPIHYVVNADGITISQEAETQTMAWEQMTKFKRFQGNLFIFTSRVNAIIFPCVQLGEQAEGVAAFIAAQLQKGEQGEDRDI